MYFDYGNISSFEGIRRLATQPNGSYDVVCSRVECLESMVWRGLERGQRSVGRSLRMQVKHDEC